jgi:nucleoside-diphosphate-sugar epimerase
MLVTGAAGFLGQALVAKHVAPLAQSGACDVLLTDLAPSHPSPTHVRWVCGDVADPHLWDRLMDKPVDLVIHLAAIVSGRAEADPALGRIVNLIAPLEMLERCRLQQSTQGTRARVVLSSSIAVYGTPLPTRMRDDHPIRPSLSYGAHKRMIEIALTDASRRGEIDGRAIRLSGVVVRPPQPNGALSGFNSDMIRQPLSGNDYTCPVGPDACTWLTSLDVAIDQLWHAAQTSEARWTQALPPGERALTAPTWPVTMADLQQALGDIDAAAPQRLRFDAHSPLHDQFGRWPQDVAFDQAAQLGMPSDWQRHLGRLAHMLRATMDPINH